MSSAPETNAVVFRYSDVKYKQLDMALKKTNPGQKGNKAPKPSSRKVAPPTAFGTVVQRNSIALSTYSESERVSGVSGSAAFTVQGSYAVNPALPSLFPWLANHATLYDKYRFKKLVFRYRTTRGTQSSGNVIMSFDSDTLDPVATSSQEMSQSAVYSDGPVWHELTISIPCDGDWRFTRSAAIANSDGKTYDLGKLTVAMEGCSDALVHGYLEVDYVLEVKHKQSLVAGGISTNRQITESFNSTTLAGTTNTAIVVPAASNPVGAVAQPTGGWLLKAGSYLIEGIVNNGAQVAWDLLVDGSVVHTATAAIGGMLRKLITLAAPALVVPRLNPGGVAVPAGQAQLLIEYL